MMHSVALCESNIIVDDGDFVMIDSDQFGDDGHWDYCDDVFSTTSSNSCFSVCSDLPAKIFEGVEDLDDTKAPMLATEGDILDVMFLVESSSSTPLGMPSPFDTNFTEEGADPSHNEATQMDEYQSVDNVAGGSNQSSFVVSDDDEAKQGSVCKSRLSNKKRRKKMKLMKKAVSAAAAAVALSEMAGSAASTAKSARQPKLPQITGKKFSNVAVSSAYESIASYRQELQGARKCK